MRANATQEQETEKSSSSGTSTTTVVSSKTTPRGTWYLIGANLPYAAFVFMIIILFPFLTESLFNFSVSVLSLVFFILLTRPAHLLISSRFSSFSKNDKDELENKVVSLLFNAITGTASYLLYYDLAYPIFPHYHDLYFGNRIRWIDFFSAFSFAYVVYDFFFSKDYPRASPALIKWHHIAELMIIWSYVTNPGVGSIYIAGGGMMQLSSGIFHCRRLFELGYRYSSESPKAKEKETRAWRRGLIVFNWLLTLTWGHARVVLFPYVMYLCWANYAMSFGHGVLIFVGGALTLMNVLWFYKIVSSSSLAL